MDFYREVVWGPLAGGDGGAPKARLSCGHTIDLHVRVQSIFCVQCAYEANAPSLRCPKCRTLTFNPNDIREGYCGRCHDWTSKPEPAQASLF